MAKKSNKPTVFKPKNRDPKVGDIIYVGSAFYLSHGSDDVVGGLAEIVSIDIDPKGAERGFNRIFVETKQHPGRGLNWDILKEEQEELKKQFGKKWAYEDPDNSPESNSWD